MPERAEERAELALAAGERGERRRNAARDRRARALVIDFGFVDAADDALVPGDELHAIHARHEIEPARIDNATGETAEQAPLLLQAIIELRVRDRSQQRDGGERDLALLDE